MKGRNSAVNSDQNGIPLGVGTYLDALSTFDIIYLPRLGRLMDLMEET